MFGFAIVTIVIDFPSENVTLFSARACRAIRYEKISAAANRSERYVDAAGSIGPLFLIKLP